MDPTEPLPQEPQDVAFAQPWEAHAFALAVALHRQGLFTWREWTETLGAQVARAAAPGAGASGAGGYEHWLTALECLVAAKGASSAPELRQWRQAWERAAGRTAHGQPIDVHAGDFDAA